MTVAAEWRIPVHRNFVCVAEFPQRAKRLVVRVRREGLVDNAWIPFDLVGGGQRQPGVLEIEYMAAVEIAWALLVACVFC